MTAMIAPCVSGTWTRPGKFVGHPREVTWFAVSHDGRRILASDFNRHEQRLWGQNTREQVDRVDLGGISPTRGSFSHDGRYAAWPGTCGFLRIFEFPLTSDPARPLARSTPEIKWSGGPHFIRPTLPADLEFVGWVESRCTGTRPATARWRLGEQQLSCGIKSRDSTPPKLSGRLEVTECSFGPIPESEFAEEPFLARLQTGEIIWKQVEEPPTGTVVEWCWLAFVVGGISLAGGSGLALGSRDRDGQALRAD